MGISSALGVAGAVPVGVVNPFAGANAPAGWLMCFGQTVSRTQYVGLFLTIGTTYGSGDGSTTFAIPDMRGRAVAGKDDMGGSAASRITAGVTGVSGTTLGAAGGNQNAASHSHTFTGNAASHTHTQDSHNHSVYDPSHAHNYTARYGGYQTIGQELNVPSWSTPYGLGGGYIEGNYASTSNYGSTATNQNTSITPTGTLGSTFTGTSGNLQPTIILNYIIKAQ